MPDSDVARIVAVVPSCSGAKSLVDLDRDLGLVVVGQRMLDRADAAPADLHVVALHELAGVLEAQLVLRLPVAA